MRNGALNLGLIGLGCLSALLILEIGLRVFWRPELASWPRNLDVSIRLDDDVTTGVAGPARVVTSSRGIRGAEWSRDRAGEYRILALGASNTRCLLQDQPNTWPALLQGKLPVTADQRSVWVGNVGGGGHNSRHHVLAMRYMLDQYDPDAVIIVAGGNDPARALNEGSRYDTFYIDDPAKMRKLAWDFSERPVSLIASGGVSLRSTALGLFLREFRNRFFGAEVGEMLEDVGAIRTSRQKHRQASEIVDEMPNIQPGLQGFRHNLEAMIRLAKAHGVHLVFLTMPSLFRPEMTAAELDRLWAGWAGDPSRNAYWSPAVWAAAIGAHNRELQSVCLREKVDCLDLAALLPPSTELFWDQGHLTDRGSGRVADTLAQYFTSYFRETQR